MKSGKWRKNDNLITNNNLNILTKTMWFKQKRAGRREQSQPASGLFCMLKVFGCEFSTTDCINHSC